MPTQGPLKFQMGDMNIVSLTVVHKKTRVPVDISGALARVRFEIFSDPTNPTGSKLADMSKTLTTTPDPANGQIDDGTNGLATIIWPASDLASANPDLNRAGSYFFGIKVLDVSADPFTVYKGPASFDIELVTNT